MTIANPDLQKKLSELCELIKGKHLYVKFGYSNLNTDEYERPWFFSSSEMRKIIKNECDNPCHLSDYYIEVNHIRNGLTRVILDIITDGVLESYIISIYDRNNKKRKVKE